MGGVLPFLLVTALTMAPLTLAPAFAACGGPGFTIEVTEAAVGDRIGFSGTGFFLHCNDQGGLCRATGVSGQRTDIRLTLAQGSIAETVATVNADEEFEIAGSFVIPSGRGFQPGPAQVVLDAGGELLTTALTITS